MLAEIDDHSIDLCSPVPICVIREFKKVNF